MRRVVLFVIAIVFVCSVSAIAQSWHWALSGGYNPSTALTSEGKQAWIGGASGSCYWESVASDTSTALRIVDTSAGSKVRWDATTELMKPGTTTAMTVAFRIKLESSQNGDYTVIRITNTQQGANCQTRLQLKLKYVADQNGYCLYNSDNGLQVDGITPAEWRVDDGAWHTFRSLHTVNPDGSIHYRIYWDEMLVQDYDASISTSEAGKFGTDSNANIFTYQLDYFAISLDGAWTEDQLPSPCEFFITAGPQVNVAADRNSATVSWETSGTDVSSVVHYGTDPSCSQSVVEPGGGGKTVHSVTVPTEPYKYYYYYVESNSATCVPVKSTVRDINTGYVVNPSFEDASGAPWVTIPGYVFDGIGGYTFGIWPHTASRMAYSAANYGKKDRGGMYQIITGLTPGQFYEVSAWIWTRCESGSGQTTAGNLDAACRVGIDPTAGTYVGGWNGEVWVENGNITWSPWTQSDNSLLPEGGPWKQIRCAVRAIGTTATLYIQQQHRWAYAWNLTAFDDVWVTQAPPPPPGIGAAKGVQDGYPAMLPDKVVTAAWPGEKRFYIEEADRSSAIKVVVPSEELVPAIGSKVTVSGFMGTSQHRDRYVGAVEVTNNGTANVPKPIAMSNKSVGSTANAGLLVTVWGKVLENPLHPIPGYAQYDPGPSSDLPGYDPYGRNYMYIDDGSNVNGDYILLFNEQTGEWYNTGLLKGVKVYYHPDYYMPWPGEYVICTGIAGHEWCDSNYSDNGGDFSLVRTLEMRQTLPVDESSIPMHLSDLLLFPAGSY